MKLLEADGGRGRERPRWENGVKKTLGYGGLIIQGCERHAWDRMNRIDMAYRGKLAQWVKLTHMKLSM